MDHLPVPVTVTPKGSNYIRGPSCAGPDVTGASHVTRGAPFVTWTGELRFRKAGIEAKFSPIIEKLSEGQGLSLNYLTLIQDFATRERAEMKFSPVKRKRKVRKGVKLKFSSL